MEGYRFLVLSTETRTDFDVRDTFTDSNSDSSVLGSSSMDACFDKADIKLC